MQTIAQPAPATAAPRVSYAYAYAYSPRENVGSRGTVHVVAEQPIRDGRRWRDAGQTLCTTRRFWGLDGRTQERFLQTPCKKCMEIAKRLGIA